MIILFSAIGLWMWVVIIGMYDSDEVQDTVDLHKELFLDDEE